MQTEDYKIINGYDMPAPGWYFKSCISGSDKLHGPYRTDFEADLAARKHIDTIKWGNVGGFRAHRASASFHANYDCNTEGFSADERLRRWKRDGLAS